MKARLEYNLPTEQTEFQAALNALEYKAALRAIDEALRSRAKYGDKPETTWQEARDLFWSHIPQGLEIHE